jgi:hypothetical protein
MSTIHKKTKVRVCIEWGGKTTHPAYNRDDVKCVALRFWTVPDDMNPQVCDALEERGLHVKRRCFGHGCWNSAVLNPPPMKELPQVIEIDE